MVYNSLLKLICGHLLYLNHLAVEEGGAMLLLIHQLLDLLLAELGLKLVFYYILMDKTPTHVTQWEQKNL